MALNDFRPFSPIDPANEKTGRGKWFDAGLAAVAEAFYRAKLGKPARPRFPPATSQDAVRRDCREIPAGELTTAERAKLMPSINALSDKAQRLVLTTIKRSNAAFRPPPSEYTATEIPPPRAKPSHVDVPVEQVMASLQRLEGGD